VAEGDLRELRIAARELRSVTDQRSDLMRQMRSHLRQLGLSFAKSAWSSVIGRRRIDELVAQVQASHGMRGLAIARLWGRIETMNAEVGHWHEQVEKWSKKFDAVAKLQQQLPGVGPVIAATVWSELGDPRRYPRARSFAKATGLTPGYRRSGGRQSKQAITREGSSHVRWALTRAVLACLRCQRGPGLAVRQWVQRMSRRKCKKAAMVAAARKLAESIWRLFALGEAFDLAQVFGAPPPPLHGAPPRPPASGGPRKPPKVTACAGNA
jgi:transposase